MNMLSAPTIISQPTPFRLPLHSHYLHLSPCILTSQSPLLPAVHSHLSSLCPFRQRQIRWRPAHRKAVSKTVPDLKLAAGSEDEAGTWKVSSPVSHALRPKGQHFKRDDPQTSLQRMPDFHWLSCCGLQELPPPPKCIRIPIYGCLS